MRLVKFISSSPCRLQAHKNDVHDVISSFARPDEYTVFWFCWETASRAVSVFSALLSPTVETCSCDSLSRREDLLGTFILFRFSPTAAGTSLRSPRDLKGNGYFYPRAVLLELTGRVMGSVTCWDGSYFTSVSTCSIPTFSRVAVVELLSLPPVLRKLSSLGRRCPVRAHRRLL